MAVILGIDPGSCKAGFALLHTQGQRWRALDYGVIRLKAKAMSLRLAQLHQHLAQLIQQHQPTCVAMEAVFIRHNPQSALKLGQARGAVLALAGCYALEVHSYPPRKIKQTWVGYGGADKAQMQRMAQQLLHLTEQPAEDAADALAVAWCHAAHTPLQPIPNQKELG